MHLLIASFELKPESADTFVADLTAFMARIPESIAAPPDGSFYRIIADSRETSPP